MTAQAPERIILDGRPRLLYARPLDKLAKDFSLDLARPHWSNTANYRGYIGTWEVRDGRLNLVQLCWDGYDGEVPISDDLRRHLFRAAQCDGFPIPAHWFNGVIRLAIGRRVIYSHHGWSHWFERERVLHFVAGKVTRDREVDTRAILEWWLRRHPAAAERLDPSNPDPLGPLTWFDDDEEDWAADWWPPDYVRGSGSAR